MKKQFKTLSVFANSIITPVCLGVMGTLAVSTKHPAYIIATAITLSNMVAVYWIQKRINEFEEGKE